MDKNNLTDYYPVYKDVADLTINIPLDQNFEYLLSGKEFLSGNKIYESEYSGSTAVLNGELLTDLALKCGLSKFQTILLLLKNSFEGHVFLKYNIRPDQLFSQGTTIFQSKPEIMILDFYENFSQHEAGLNQIWRIMQERDPDPDPDPAGISFELLVHNLIVNHLIRFPVSLFSSPDIRSYNDESLMNQQAMNQQFEMVLLGERFVGEYRYIEKVNVIYAGKFKEFVHHLRIKEDVLSHYQRKLVLALFPDINTEKELDDLMYRKLLEEKMSRTPQNILNISPDDHVINESPIWKLRIREKTKILYRSVSKNCSEVHSVTDSENSFPELTHIFLEANSIYTEAVTTMADALLQYMRLVLLSSEVVIFRKTHGFTLAENLQLIYDFRWKEVLSKDELRLLGRNLDARLVAFRLKSLTDYKMKFIVDDDLTDIHNHFLQKQIDFRDQQIIQIQSDIKEVLKMKSQVSILNTSKN